MIDLSNALKNSLPLQVHAHWDPIADATYDLHKAPENLELFDLSPNEPIREYKGRLSTPFFHPQVWRWEMFGNWIWIA